MKRALVFAATLLFPDASAFTMTSPQPLIAGHAKADRSHRFQVALPVGEAFPLFEPVGEMRWAEGWQPVFAADADAALHAGSVFTVERPSPSGPVTSLWLVTAYDPAIAAIEYRSLIPGVRVAHIQVQCRAAGAGATEVTVRYRYTGLSAEGDAFIATMDDAAFRTFIGHWEDSIRAALAREASAGAG